jgi:hypothetical protein
MNEIEKSFDRWCAAEGIPFVSEGAEQAYKARTRRIADAILLREPDRVPVTPMMEYFYGRYGEVTAHDVLYDAEVAERVTKKTVMELEPDAYQPPLFYALGPLYDALDLKQIKWAGHGLPRDNAHQFVEDEYMKEDEYDAFLKDPSDYMMRTFLPRSCGNLEGLGRLAPLRNMFAYYTMYTPLAGLGTPDGKEAVQALLKAGEASLNYLTFMGSVNGDLAANGFPIQDGSIALAPFDAISDTMRGTRGAILDMFRRPDVLKEACEQMLWIVLDIALSAAQASDNPMVFIPLHKGTANTRDGKGGFMSLDQFEEFYWPTLQKLIVRLVDNGLVPRLLIEGDYTSRLHIVKDVPKASCIFHFEAVDWVQAKEVLGGHVCIRGGLPIQLMVTGTPDQVEARAREAIDVLADGGGYIMDAAMASEDVKVENMRAMIETCKSYGVYG